MSEEAYFQFGAVLAKQGLEELKENPVRKFEDQEARERTEKMNEEKKEKGFKSALAQHKNKLYLGKETWWEVPQKYHSALMKMGFHPDDYLIKKSDSSTYTKEERYMLKNISKKNQRKAKRNRGKGGDGKPAVVLPRYMGSGPFQLDNGDGPFQLAKGDGPFQLANGDGSFHLANGTDPLSHVDASTAGEFQLGDWDDSGVDPDSPTPIHVHSGDEDEEEEAMTKEEEEYIKSVIGPEKDWVDFFDDYVECQMASC